MSFLPSHVPPIQRGYSAPSWPMFPSVWFRHVSKARDVMVMVNGVRCNASQRLQSRRLQDEGSERARVVVVSRETRERKARKLIFKDFYFLGEKRSSWASYTPIVPLPFYDRTSLSLWKKNNECLNLYFYDLFALNSLSFHPRLRKLISLFLPFYKEYRKYKRIIKDVHSGKNFSNYN